MYWHSRTLSNSLFMMKRCHSSVTFPSHHSPTFQSHHSPLRMIPALPLGLHTTTAAAFTAIGIQLKWPAIMSCRFATPLRLSQLAISLPQNLHAWFKTHAKGYNTAKKERTKGHKPFRYWSLRSLLKSRSFLSFLSSAIFSSPCASQKHFLNFFLLGGDGCNR